jgi:hypothetical protein
LSGRFRFQIWSRFYLYEVGQELTEAPGPVIVLLNRG